MASEDSEDAGGDGQEAESGSGAARPAQGEGSREDWEGKPFKCQRRSYLILKVIGSH